MLRTYCENNIMEYIYRHSRIMVGPDLKLHCKVGIFLRQEEREERRCKRGFK